MSNQAQIKPFNNSELAAFCGQSEQILKSGISIFEGISIMLEDAQNPEEQKILEHILGGIELTGSFHKALADTGMFPAYMLHMVAIGEETGKLDDVMGSLANHYDREDSISKSIRNAITYPAIISAMMVAVVIVLLVKVMPIFNQVFNQLGTEMSGISRVLMHIGNLISAYSFAFVILLAVLAALVILSAKTIKGKSVLRNICYRFKSTRRIFENMASSRLAGTMALALSSGLTAEIGLEFAASMNDDPAFAKKIANCQSLLEDGEELSKALQKSEIFTGVYARMAYIGQKAGSIDKAMEEIAERYQSDADDRMSNVLAILEPSLVIALSVIVGIILLSVMLPLVGIMSGI